MVRPQHPKVIKKNQSKEEKREKLEHNCKEKSLYYHDNHLNNF